MVAIDTLLKPTIHQNFEHSKSNLPIILLANPKRRTLVKIIALHGVQAYELKQVLGASYGQYQQALRDLIKAGLVKMHGTEQRPFFSLVQRAFTKNQLQNIVEVDSLKSAIAA